MLSTHAIYIYISLGNYINWQLLALAKFFQKLGSIRKGCRHAYYFRIGILIEYDIIFVHHFYRLGYLIQDMSQIIYVDNIIKSYVLPLTQQNGANLFLAKHIYI